MNSYSRIVYLSLGLIVLITVAYAVAYFISNTNFVELKHTNEVAIAQIAETEETSKGFQKKIQSKGGIDVTVTDIVHTDNITTVHVNLSNHQYDLSDPDIQARSLFDGVPAESFNILSSVMGGHHVEAELEFPGNLNGELTIGPTSDILLTFQDL